MPQSLNEKMENRHICRRTDAPLSSQLLKWIGNKQKFAKEIISYFPTSFGVYHEPFLGSGAVLGTLAPIRACGSDSFLPLVEIWQALREDPDQLKEWYKTRWLDWRNSDRVQFYDFIRDRFHQTRSGADFLFLSRTAYGGVIRFRKSDGYMSTPCGAHDPIHFDKFAKRVDEWRGRVAGTEFFHHDYQQAFDRVKTGDLVYCDPPYDHSQAILYGAQGFDYDEFFKNIATLKQRGAFVALSLNKQKSKQGAVFDYAIPNGLFARDVPVNCGTSMLKRFQMGGATMQFELVTDSLYLTH